MAKLVFKETIPKEQSGHAAEYLTSRTGLPKARVKDALVKGAVWLRTGKGPLRRIRKATSPIKAGEHIELHYDPELLAIVPPKAQLLRTERNYSIWLKPSGLMAQGTMFGDHCSLLRQAEQHFLSRQQVFLVHRLDREAAGIMLVAHTKEAAARLSAIFSGNKVGKRYRIEALGDVSQKGKAGVIRLPLDGKDAVTHYTVLSFDPAKNVSVVDLRIETGRLHQIRRHFDMIGHPVMGDPKYGKGNKNKEGMRLVAYGLSFVCPFSKKPIDIAI